jgi:hypothetical protein
MPGRWEDLALAHYGPRREEGAVAPARSRSLIRRDCQGEHKMPCRTLLLLTFAPPGLARSAPALDL